MILTDRTMTVNGNTASLDSNVYLYRGDKNVEINFNIVNSKFRFTKKSADNIIESSEAFYSIVKLIAPNGAEIEFPATDIENGKAKWLIEGELIDELDEVGTYNIQIRLLNNEKDSIITMPPVYGQVEVSEPLFMDDTAITGVSKTTVSKTSFLSSTQRDTLNPDGTYNKKTWESKELIYESDLNTLEDIASKNRQSIINDEKEIATLKTKVETLESTSSSQNEQLNSQRVNISNLQGTLAEHTTKISDNESSINILRQDLNTGLSNKSDKTTVDAIDDRVRTLETTSAEHTTKLEQQTTALTTLEQNTNSKLDLKTNKTDFDSLKSDVQSNTSKINTNTTVISEHTSKLNTHDAQITNLQNEVGNISETIEGSYITVKDSKDGYIQELEIFGNTIQGPSNLADIQSVGTLREDGLYEMSILSCGKNLFDKNITFKQKTIHGSTTNGSFVSMNEPIKVKSGITYYLSNNKNLRIQDIAFYKNGIEQNLIASHRKFTFTVPEGCTHIKLCFYDNNGINATKPFDWIQLEEGTVATPYEAYQVNKSSILLPCQLEKVGDVSDRLFRREDGVWCIEKNVGEVVLNGSENWDKTSWVGTNTSAFNTLPNKVQSYSDNVNIKVVCDKFKGFSRDVLYSQDVEGVSSSGYIVVRIANTKLTSQDVTGFKAWLSQNPTLVKYQLATPQIIELPLDVQIQLNSFNRVTNIFTEEAVIEPTIKATVPKSLGASVNSLVNKTDILSDRIEKVETLQEGNELEVSTDKGYVVCENTRNGYVEDLKVEGNTLVNLAKYKYKTSNVVQSGNKFTFNAPISSGKESVFYNLPNMLEVGKTYTIILNITFNTLIGNEKPVKVVYSSQSYGGYFDLTTEQSGLIIKTVSPKVSDTYPSIFARDITSGSFTIENFMILEGDYTQNPPSYFEGLKSVGDGVDKIEVLSSNGNLLNGISMAKNIQQIASGILDTENKTIKFDCPIIQGKEIKTIKYDKGSYTFIFKGYNTGGTHPFSNLKIMYTDGTSKELPNFDSQGFSKIVSDANKTISHIEGNWASVGTLLYYDECYIIKGNRLDYEIQQDKKQILYQTKEANYEKPVLRSTGSVSDTIEKHSDGKYYFHKRCEEIVLNGSETWIRHSYWDTTNTLTFYLDYNAYKSYNKPIAVKEHSECVSNLFPYAPYRPDFVNLLDKEKIIMYGGVGSQLTVAPCINILKSKLSSQDVVGLQTWLQSNPLTVVYQLATEEVYECVNLDLDSYEGETSIIYDGGAISPKITFKIASHIANTISVLKDRINYLESKVIGMFKAVLSGDVQTLAYELYPEDFENNE